MSHDHHHHHGHHHHFDTQREGNKKGLLIALIITAGIMVLEFVGGLFTNSLALLSYLLQATSSNLIKLTNTTFDAFNIQINWREALIYYESQS